MQAHRRSYTKHARKQKQTRDLSCEENRTTTNNTVKKKEHNNGNNNDQLERSDSHNAH